MAQDLTRKPGWEARLSAWIMGCMGRPFAPGKMDCALFAAGAVEAVSGVDLAAPFRGYRTLAGGAKRVRKAGYADHEAVFAERLRAAPLAMLAEGDVVAVETDGGTALGVLSGAVIYVMGPDGLGMVPAARAVRGFAI